MTHAVACPAASTSQMQDAKAECKEQAVVRRKSLQQRRGKRPYASFTHEQTRTLTEWLNGHLRHPYPSCCDLVALADETGLTTTQVQYWFINARVRKLVRFCVGLDCPVRVRVWLCPLVFPHVLP